MSENGKEVANRFEVLAQGIAYLDRDTLIERIQSYKGRFKRDFTDEFLRKMINKNNKK